MTQRSPKPKLQIDTATPTAELVAKAVKQDEITDANGRKIVLRKPGPLAQYRIVEAVGPERSRNETYMAMVNPLIWIASIDGEPVATPITHSEVEALIIRLDDVGLEAVMGWFMENIAAPAMEAMDLAEQRARLKNS